MQVSRRQFLAAMMAGGAIVAGDLWIPGQKLISIPSKKFFIPDGRLAWLEDGVMWMYDRGGSLAQIPKYFDVEVRGAEISRDAFEVIRRHGSEMWR